MPRPTKPSLGRTTLVVAAGGIIGALLRYQCALLWPTADGHFPYTTLLVNVFGCLVMGAFVTWVLPRASALVRPFVGTGILGGFTTFSTYSVEAEQLLRDGRAATALIYLFGTAVAAIAGVLLGIIAIRRYLAAR